VKNREKAKIHIGDKVPVITSNTTSTGVISESVSYLDVGLKLDVEPSVLMREDVQIKVGLEVSNIVREIRSTSGTLTYQIGTRNAGTTLRLKDGETQVLAGLIADEDRTAASRVPGLGNLPVLGRLFSNQRDERNKTEIVLLITPRVLRSDATRQPALTEFRGGTENAIGGGIAAPFTAAAEPLRPPQPALPAELQPETPADAAAAPDTPVPQIPPPPSAGD
jgi:general secretion pathway protein D